MNKSNYEIVIALGTNENQEINMRTAKQLLRQLQLVLNRKRQ